MAIKIFHTADLHIGMKFNNYPDIVKNALQQARIDVLDKMIEMANEEKCNLFVIAGDLFHSISGVDKKTLSRVLLALEAFQGECVLVMPGNHDYDNDMIELWKGFNKIATEKIVYFNEERPFSLVDYGLNVMVYPGPCHAKHSNTNNIGWVKDQPLDQKLYHIGIAHGSLEGISPDLEGMYYYMSPKELENIPVDVWLLGHTHVTYPNKTTVSEWKIFNPGTPEPDGLDCKHAGVAWIITIDEQKKTSANQVATGIYKFIDQEYEINNKEDLEAMQLTIIRGEPSKTIARIHLRGRVEEDTFNYRQEVYKDIENAIAYLIIDDAELGLKVTKEKIHKEFSEGSFPQQFLFALSEDEDALQIAYELIVGVKK
ncbi:MAG: hypothetical protein CVV02_00630 [Firmicutes bacterium HGW-Firmicutes-7]|nr:MAG: hypothetical protein CVV02_00630 [Firmicutes bacterium HGW-Firmicutes-7]